MEFELDVCPFCGGKSRVREDFDSGLFSAVCLQCLATTSWFDDAEQAARHWDSRVKYDDLASQLSDILDVLKTSPGVGSEIVEGLRLALVDRAKVVVCMFCGYAVESKDPVETTKIISEHILVCEKNPLSIKVRVYWDALDKIANKVPVHEMRAVARSALYGSWEEKD